MSGWWDSIASNAKLLVDELSAQANEATNEIVNEQLKLREEERARKARSLESLPWESNDESKSIISEALMADILQLALSEKNFTHPPPAKIVEYCNFDLQTYISQAMRLLSLDQNLAHVHAKISPKMDEEKFWKHYFTRIYYLRCKSGILGCPDDPIVQTVASFAEDDVIYKSNVSAGTAPGVKSSSSSTKKSSTPPPPPSVDSDVVVKKSAWENSSGEDVSSSESVLSTSSYEVVAAGGKGAGTASDSVKSTATDDAALLEAQVQSELKGAVTSSKDSDVDDEDFDDLEDFNDLDDLGDEEDDDELEAQIARELANEE